MSARGGPTGGAGGWIEVSGHGSLNYSGSADAGARLGKEGQLLLDPKNLIISAAPSGVFPQFDLIDPHPTPGGRFGNWVTVLSNGNIAVTTPDDSFGGSHAGAVYLFDGLSGALISSLIGSDPGDDLGNNSVTLLTNGNFLVPDPSWNGYRGAATWGNGASGVSGPISAANSLVGSNPGDRVGADITPLSNGNYLVTSYSWNGNRGAVTWGNGTSGVTGEVSATNSLVGSNSNDFVGYSPIVLLSNGNYLVQSLNWNGSRGAVTWGSGATGVRGIVSGTNSLIGSNPNDHVGYSGVTTLSNGNYLIQSRNWNGNRGAVTWGNGTTGVSGLVSATNSLVGSNPGEAVGNITILSNGNYVVRTPNWNNSRGAVTWGNGTQGVAGLVSGTNSLVGVNPGDQVGSNGVTALSNGDYVVLSPIWNGRFGAATWGNGATGVTGAISAMNSLIGANASDSVGSQATALNNGNYVVESPYWNNQSGAVTWGSGTTGISGSISSLNSLVGSNPNDLVGISITALDNASYLVESRYWNGNRGAVTWGNGTTGINGPVSAMNSLIGSNPNDLVGSSQFVTLNNGNYVVRSPYWNGNRGAVTWGSGTAGVRGPVSAANSLVGVSPNDRVGYVLPVPLNNGNYAVPDLAWNGQRGAVTWGNGATGTSGAVDATNSLVGTNPDDQVGGGVIPLTDGNYVVSSPRWNQTRGAVTWGNGTTGASGPISVANSLVGANPGDSVGSVHPLSNGNYVVTSLHWSEGRGAVTWGSGIRGVSGLISEANSLIGTDPNDAVGNYLVTTSNGNYLVDDPYWHNRRGAVTWGNGTVGQTLDARSVITDQNSVIGRTANSDIRGVVLDAVHESFLVPFDSEGSGRVTVGFTDPNQSIYTRARSQTVTLTPDFLTATLNTGTAVVLQASNDITIDDPITVHANGHGGALTLQAGRSILLNASITTDNGPLTLIANDTRADGVVDSQRDPGNATIVMAGGTTLDTGTAPLDIELRDGAGLTHADSRAINLQTLSAVSVTVSNNGPDAGSDIRLGAVTTSGSQSYRNPHGVTTVTADLTTGDSPITFTDSVVINDGVNVDTGSGTVNFAGTGTQTLQLGASVSFANVHHTGSGTLQLTSALTLTGTLLQSAGTFDANDQPVTVSGAAVFTGGTYLAGTAPQTFAGGLVLTAGTFTSSTGPMTIRGGVTLTGGTFGGQGSVDQLTVYGGTVAPGTDTPGILSVAGPMSFNPLTTFNVLLDGTHAGRGYSQLRAAGPVNLGGSTLQLVPGLEPPLGRAIKILATTASRGIQGAFAGLPEGAVFDQAGFRFQITYHGGTKGRDVVLTRVA